MLLHERIARLFLNVSVCKITAHNAWLWAGEILKGHVSKHAANACDIAFFCGGIDIVPSCAPTLAVLSRYLLFSKWEKKL